MQFDIVEIWGQATGPVKFVILTMGAMGVGSIYVALERAWALTKARNQSRALAGELAGAFAKGDGAAAVQLANKPEYKDSYLGHLLVPGLNEFLARKDRHGIEAAERALQRVSIAEDASLRKGFGILATTGATCPFVGLVGTIFGIIGAFQAMADGGGDMDKLLLPIAEALIATAIGIAVAIVGVWLFNFFTAKVEAITRDMNTSVLELIDWCEKQLIVDEPATSAK
ncbi:MAG: TolQ protein [Pseudomonadota bacterium]